MTITIYCDPQGSDHASGRNDTLSDKTHGPVRSLRAALQRVRVERAIARANGASPPPSTVVLADGTYPLVETLKLDGSVANGLTVQARHSGKAALDGGIRLGDLVERQVNGQRVFAANVAALLKLGVNFRQLFVNDKRAQPARTQELRVEGISEAHSLGNKVFGLKLAPSALPKLEHTEQTEALVPSLFSCLRLPVAGFDTESSTLLLQKPVERARLTSSMFQPFVWLEHVLEELGPEGTWCCDRSQGLLYYVPRAGESLGSVELVVSPLTRLLTVTGTPEAPVQNLVFSGVRFRHADYEPVFQSAQSDPYVAPTLSLEHVHYFGFHDCAFEHLGGIALGLGEGAKWGHIVGSSFTDLGGGGIIANGGTIGAPPATWVEGHRVTDNEFSGLGRVFLASSAILFMNASRNTISYNRIQDLFYTGISVGWTWGYHRQITADNHIEHNHIFNLGQGVLSDLAGIYTLGVQPGTTIRHNLIHDITRRDYGGFGINLDEGSSHIVLEHNVIYNISSQCLHQHFGRENQIRNNIFAYADEGLISLSRGNRLHWPDKGGFDDGSITNAFSLQHNLFLSAGQAIFVGALGDATGSVKNLDFLADGNVYWDEQGEPFFGDGVHGKGGRESMTVLLSFTDWQALGRDATGKVADPGCRAPHQGDFRPERAESAFAFGPSELPLKVGPRPPEERSPKDDSYSAWQWPSPL